MKHDKIKDVEELLKLYYYAEESEIYSNEMPWKEEWDEDRAIKNLRAKVSEFAVRFNIKNPADV